MITPEQIANQKATLPRGWGRFGKAVDYLIEVSLPDEELLATCVTLNPSFQHRTISTAGTLLELTSSTNTLLAATNQRLIVVATGAAGTPRSDYVISYEGLSIVAEGKKEITLRWADGVARFRGAAKTQLPALIDCLKAHIHPAD